MCLKGRLWFVAGAVGASLTMLVRKLPCQSTVNCFSPSLAYLGCNPPGGGGKERAGAKEEGNASGKDPPCFHPVPFPFFPRRLLLPLPPSLRERGGLKTQIRAWRPTFYGKLGRSF